MLLGQVIPPFQRRASQLNGVDIEAQIGRYKGVGRRICDVHLGYDALGIFISG